MNIKLNPLSQIVVLLGNAILGCNQTDEVNTYSASQKRATHCFQL